MWLDAGARRHFRGPPPIDGIGPTEGWQDYWKEFDATPPQRSSWAAHPGRRWSLERCMHLAENGRPVDGRAQDGGARGRAAHPGRRARRRAPLLRRPARHAARQDPGRGRDRRGAEERRRLHGAPCCSRTPPTAPCSRCGTPAAASACKELRGRGRHHDAARPVDLPGAAVGAAHRLDAVRHRTSPTAGRCRSARGTSDRQALTTLADAGYDFIAGLEVEFHLFKLDRSQARHRAMQASPASRASRPKCRCSTRATST